MNGDSELARVASEGYLNNRDSIECLRCSFVVRVGEAESVERAKEGDITPVMSAKGMTQSHAALPCRVHRKSRLVAGE